MQLVAAEIGICIVPEEFRHILPKQVRLIALDAENAWSDVVMVWSKNADGVIQRCTGIHDQTVSTMIFKDHRLIEKIAMD